MHRKNKKEKGIAMVLNHFHGGNQKNKHYRSAQVMPELPKSFFLKSKVLDIETDPKHHRWSKTSRGTNRLPEGKSKRKKSKKIFRKINKVHFHP